MNSPKEQACAQVDKLQENLIAIATEIFEHPELSSQEHRAAQLLSRELHDAGFSVELGVAGMETAIRASHPAVNDGPSVAILGEYDALPELGHACGHNLIGVAALGACLGLEPVKVALPGRLTFLGTPAEEYGSGKVAMIKVGVFNDIDSAMMFHPSSFTAVDRGSLAVTEVRIEFSGKAAHAAGCPEKGINALDAVIQTFNGINALRQHIKDRARIHGVITKGGVKPNIVPDHAVASFFVRAPEDCYRDELVEKLSNCARGAALATGATLSLELLDPNKAMIPNRTLGEVFRQNLELLGEPLDPPQGDSMGSTDMGDVSQVVPALHAYIQICEEDVAVHSREFAQAAGSSRGMAAMIVASKALAMTAIDVFTNPGLVRRMESEFRRTPEANGK